jgi:L-arabinonolactonase
MKVIKPDLELVIDSKNYLGETPVWSVGEQALYWVNCEQSPELHRWIKASGEHKVWPMPERIGGFVLKETGGALVVLASGLFDLDLESGALTKRLQATLEHAALHECQCDRQGRFWVGSIDHRVAPGVLPEGGAFFRLDGNKLTEMFDGVSCSNGLAFSPDGRTLYHTDAPTQIVHAWDLDPKTGEISNRREFIKLEADQGFVDGATVDAEGGYWGAMVFAGKLHRYLPDGTLDTVVELPFATPTKIAFGGPDLGTLYITTMRMLVDGASDGLGGVFAFTPGVKGLPDPLLPA